MKPKYHPDPWITENGYVVDRLSELPKHRLAIQGLGLVGHPFFQAEGQSQSTHPQNSETLQ